MGISLLVNKILNDNLLSKQQSSVLLRYCRPKRGVDPILLLSMFNVHRSRLIRWRLYRLAGGAYLTCTWCRALPRTHIISCFRLHARLFLPFDIADPISFFPNRIPTNPPSTRIINK